MVLYCIWCEDRITVRKPQRLLRKEASCIVEAPPQASGRQRSGVYVCMEITCQAKMLPRVVEGVCTEWVQFHKTRRLVTSLRHSGLTTREAFAHLELASEEITEPHRGKILAGLKLCYDEPNARKLVSAPMVFFCSLEPPPGLNPPPPFFVGQS